MKSKYFYMLLGFKTDPPMDERLRREGLKEPCNPLK